MTCKEIKITHEIGLTAKAAAVFVATANEYASQINVEFKNFKINGKSIMGVLSLGAKKGDTIYVTANGLDEVEAIEALAKLGDEPYKESTPPISIR